MTWTEDDARRIAARLEANGARQSDEVRAALAPAKPRSTGQQGAPRYAPEAVAAQDSGSPLEAAFLDAIGSYGHNLPLAVREYEFAAPLRAFRFDFAYPVALVAVECDGGQHVSGGGRHNTDEDRFKLNLAAALGWRVLRFSGAQLRTEPAACITLVRRALERSTR